MDLKRCRKILTVHKRRKRTTGERNIRYACRLTTYLNYESTTDVLKRD